MIEVYAVGGSEGSVWVGLLRVGSWMGERIVCLVCWLGGERGGVHYASLGRLTGLIF